MRKRKRLMVVKVVLVATVVLSGCMGVLINRYQRTTRNYEVVEGIIKRSSTAVVIDRGFSNRCNVFSLRMNDEKGSRLYAVVAPRGDFRDLWNPPSKRAARFEVRDVIPAERLREEFGGYIYEFR